MTFKKVRAVAEADASAIGLALFRDEHGRVCGWFLGPLRIAPDGINLPYLPRSSATMAAVAVVRAIEAARRAKAPLCIIDPDDLWEPAWQGLSA